MSLAAIWINLDNILSEVKSERERYHLIYFVYMWNFKKWCKGTYLQNRDSDIETLPVTKGERVSGGMNRECGISRHKLLYTHERSNKALQDSSRNYMQYSIINQNGKEQNQESKTYSETIINQSLKLTQMIKISRQG